MIIPEKKEFDEEERKIGEQIIEDIKKEEEKAGFFKKVFSKITKIKISEEEFEEYSKELEMLLIENNVALEVAEKITEMLKEKIVGKEFLKKEIEAQIKFAFEDIIREILIEPFDLIEKIKLKKAENKGLVAGPVSRCNGPPPPRKAFTPAVRFSIFLK